MNTSEVPTVVVDTDSLIALFNKDDANSKKAEILFQMLYQKKARLIYPATTLAETVDTLQRRLKKHKEAEEIARLIGAAQFAQESIESITGAILKDAVSFFKKRQSKGNTLADAVVAAVAQKYNASVFSFDDWYRKLGFKLVPDIY